MRFSDDQLVGDRPDETNSIQGELESSGRQTAAIRDRLREAHRELRRIVDAGSGTTDRK